MPYGSQDFVSQLNQEVGRTVALLTREIRQREDELARLMAQAKLCRDAIREPGTQRAPSRAAGESTRQATVAGSARRAPRGSSRVDWDAVLASLPSTFGVADVLQHPGPKARGRAQVYPALTRWQQANKIKKVGTGRYQRV